MDAWKKAASTGWFQIMAHYDYFKSFFSRGWYQSNFALVKPIMVEGLQFLATLNQQRKI